MKKIDYSKLYTKRKDGRYQASYIEDGKRCYLYDRDPEALYNKVQGVGTPVVLTFSAVADEWAKQKVENVEYKTAEGYVAPLKRLKKCFGNVAVDEVTPTQMQALVNDLSDKGYTRSTVQRPLDVARMIIDYAIVHYGLRINNPCNAVKLPRGLTQGIRELAEPDKIEKVKAGVNLPFGLYAYMMMYTGMRDGELLAITDKDIDYGYITVCKSVSWQPNKPVIKAPKTVSGNRKIFVLKPLADVLPQFTGYLFSADDGQSPLTQTQFRKRWATYCRDAGLADATVTRYAKKVKSNFSNTPETITRYYTRTKWTPTIVPYQLRHEYYHVL